MRRRHSWSSSSATAPSSAPGASASSSSSSCSLPSCIQASASSRQRLLQKVAPPPPPAARNVQGRRAGSLREARCAGTEGHDRREQTAAGGPGGSRQALTVAGQATALAARLGRCRHGEPQGVGSEDKSCGEAPATRRSNAGCSLMPPRTRGVLVAHGHRQEAVAHPGGAGGAQAGVQLARLNPSAARVAHVVRVAQDLLVGWIGSEGISGRWLLGNSSKLVAPPGRCPI